MSYTIVFDRAEQDRQSCNIINKAFRHCRVVNVKMKPRPLPIFTAPTIIGDFPLYPRHEPSIWTPNTAQPIQWWQKVVVT